MTLDFHQLALLALLGTAIHWLAARAAITKWFWDLRWWPIKGTKVWLPHDGGYQVTPMPCIRNVLRTLLSELLACAACSGWWIGFGLGIAGIRSLIVPSATGPWTWIAVVSSALLGTVTIPILEGVLLWGLRATHIGDGE